MQTISALAELDQAIATADGLADVNAADETACRLLATYVAEAAASDATATRHDYQVAAARNAATDSDEDRTRVLGETATARERIRAAQDQVTFAGVRLTATTAAGLVPAGTAPGPRPRTPLRPRLGHQPLPDLDHLPARARPDTDTSMSWGRPADQPAHHQDQQPGAQGPHQIALHGSSLSAATNGTISGRHGLRGSP